MLSLILSCMSLAGCAGGTRLASGVPEPGVKTIFIFDTPTRVEFQRPGQADTSIVVVELIGSVDDAADDRIEVNVIEIREIARIWRPAEGTIAIMQPTLPVHVQPAQAEGGLDTLMFIVFVVASLTVLGGRFPPFL